MQFTVAKTALPMGAMSIANNALASKNDVTRKGRAQQLSKQQKASKPTMHELSSGEVVETRESSTVRGIPALQLTLLATTRCTMASCKLPSSNRSSRVLAAALTVGMSALGVRGCLRSAIAPRLS